MTCGIYKITNNINNKSYIGQSKNIERRFRAHKERAFNTFATDYNNAIHKAFRKYELKNFTFEVIEECLVADLDSKERYWIDYYQSYINLNGYNLTLGGNSAVSHTLTFQQIEEITDLLINTTLQNKEIGNKYGVSENTISGINTGYYWKRDNIEYPIREKIKQKKNYCIDCGVEIGTYTTRCTTCQGLLRRKVDRPDSEVLLELVAVKGFAATGRLYGVADNTIKKWCIAYGLPSSIKEIKKLYYNK